MRSDCLSAGRVNKAVVISDDGLAPRIVIAAEEVRERRVLGQGAAEIHTSAEHISVADLEGMTAVTAALIDLAHNGG